MITMFFLRHGIKTAIALIVLFLIMSIGWAARGWVADKSLAEKDLVIARMEKAVADEKTKRAEVSSMAATAALTQIETAAYLMRSAVDNYNLDQSKVAASLSGISQELKAIKAVKPLPVDCKPDAERVNNLRKSIDATNNAIKR